MFTYSDFIDDLPKIEVPIQVHMVAMLVRVGFAVCSVGAELAAKKVVLLVECDIEALLDQPVGCGHTGQTGSYNYHFRHLALELLMIIKLINTEIVFCR